MSKMNPALRRPPGKPQYLSNLDLTHRYGIDRATVWRWVESGILPPPIRFTKGCTRWRVDEIEARDADRAAARNAG